MIRLVLFDIDGTLVQTGGAGVQAFGRAFATEFNVPNGTERLKFSGRTDTGLARELFLAFGELRPPTVHASTLSKGGRVVEQKWAAGPRPEGDDY